MIKTLQEDDEPEKAWLDAYWNGMICRIKLYKLIAHDAFVSCVNCLYPWFIKVPLLVLISS